MDKPARLMVAVVEARPEQPEPPPLLVFDPVIVADRIDRIGAIRPPPLLSDPFRSVGLRDPMLASPPHETERRIIGEHPKSVDRLRRLEQPDRPRRPYFVIPAQAGIQGSGHRSR